MQTIIVANQKQQSLQQLMLHCISIGNIKNESPIDADRTNYAKRNIWGRRFLYNLLSNFRPWALFIYSACCFKLSIYIQSTSFIKLIKHIIALLVWISNICDELARHLDYKLTHAGLPRSHVIRFCFWQLK